MQHSHPHMILYCVDICFYWGGNSERKLELLIIILPSSSLASLRPPSFGSLTSLFCSSLMDTWSNNFETSWISVWSSSINLRQSLDIDYWTTWGWRFIHVYRLRLIWSLIFECPFRFFPLVHRLLSTLMALRLYFAATIRRFADFGLTFNMLVKIHSDFLALYFFDWCWWHKRIRTIICDYLYRVYTIEASIIFLRFCWS